MFDYIENVKWIRGAVVDFVSRALPDWNGETALPFQFVEWLDRSLRYRLRRICYIGIWLCSLGSAYSISSKNRVETVKLSDWIKFLWNGRIRLCRIKYRFKSQHSWQSIKNKEILHKKWNSWVLYQRRWESCNFQKQCVLFGVIFDLNFELSIGRLCILVSTSLNSPSQVESNSVRSNSPHPALDSTKSRLRVLDSVEEKSHCGSYQSRKSKKSMTPE